MTRMRSRLGTAVVLLVTLATARRDVGAQSCAPERDPPRVLFAGRATHRFSKDTADLLSDHFFAGLMHGAPEVAFTNVDDLGSLLGIVATRTALDGDTSVDFTEIAGALGAPFVFQLDFDEITTGTNPEVVERTVYGTLVNTRTLANVRRFQQHLSNDDNALVAAVGSLAAQTTSSLLCDLLGQRVRPAVPALTVQVTPQEVSPNETVHVKVTLTDRSDGLVQPGKEIRIVNAHGATQLSSASYETDLFGVVEEDLSVGPDPGAGTITATFTGSDGRTTNANPESFTYRVRTTTGDLTIRAPEAALVLGAAETVTARLMQNGAPVAGATVNFAAAGGGTVTTQATTDADGYATSQYQAPTTNAVADVTASAPAPRRSPKTDAPPDLTATLTFVVDGGVTLNLGAPDTVAQGTSDVAADLVVGGAAIAGTDVTFALSGDGGLSAASAPTNAAGRAVVAWLAPTGNSTATISATAVVDGQSYSKTVTVHGTAPQGPMSVKVVPILFDHPSLATAVRVYGQFTDISHNYALAATLAASGQDAYSQLNYGTTKADVPVTVRQEAGSPTWVTVNQPDPDVVTVEFGAQSPADPGLPYISMNDRACIELQFRGAGALNVETAADMQNGAMSVQILRSKSGGPTFTGITDTQNLFPGPFGGSAQIVIAQPETLQLVLFADPTSVGGVGPNGTTRFTLTFVPQ